MRPIVPLRLNLFSNFWLIIEMAISSRTTFWTRPSAWATLNRILECSLAMVGDGVCMHQTFCLMVWCCLWNSNMLTLILLCLFLIYASNGMLTYALHTNTHHISYESIFRFSAMGLYQTITRTHTHTLFVHYRQLLFHQQIGDLCGVDKDLSTFIKHPRNTNNAVCD